MLNMFLKARNSKKKGFTIIEMVIVIAVIGILTSVLLPNFSSTLNSADSTAKAANLASVNKIAATASVSDGLGGMVEVYGAVVTNFGQETAVKTVKNAVYNMDDHTFTAMSKVKVENESAPDRNLYYPVSGDTEEEVAACLQGYDFVTYKAGTDNLTKKISEKNAKTDLKDNSGKFTEVYVINGSIALYSNVELVNALFIFTDGASLELNGYTLHCFSASFIDTSADGQTPVTFKEYGGTLQSTYGVGVFNVSNFYKDGEINWSEEATFASTTKITFYSGGFVNLGEADYSHLYLNVDDACAYIEGTILVPGNSELTLDGNTKMVVEDGGTILPGQTSAEADKFAEVSVALTSPSGTASVELAEGSFVGLTIATGSENIDFDGVAVASGKSVFTVSPLTAEVAANRVAQNAQAMIAAGGNVDAATLIVEKVGNSMVNTAVSLSSAIGALASVQGSIASAVSSATAQSISTAVNSMKTSVVSQVLASASGAASAKVSASIGTVTLTSAKGSTSKSVVSTLNSYKTCDTSWYTKNATGTEFEISTAAQLYGLSTLVYNGTDSFYGKTIKMTADIDLSAYSPWLPIGNGQYGFRGTFDGDGHTISNMNLSVNESWVALSLSQKGWNNSSNRVQTEGTAFGFQYGDKYSVGFIGVLENGGTLKDVTFSNCKVDFNNNWNSYAAVAVGAIRATGEDYCNNEGNQPAAGLNGADYEASGYAWNGSTLSDQQVSRLTAGRGKDGSAYYAASTDFRDRAYTAWTTTIDGVTVDSTCSVKATGRCGGVCAVVAGGYYNNAGYNEGSVPTGGDKSIFAGWGTVVIQNCTNEGSVTHSPKTCAYEEGGGILGYMQVLANAKSVTISNCTNSGAIKAGAAAGILGSTNGLEGKVTISGCSNTGDISTVVNDASGKTIHTSSIASSIYNTSVSTAGKEYGNQKLS